MSNIHQGHRARVKKEFRDNGISHFPDHKVLELLLFYSIPRADTNETGHALLERFGSISGVFDAPLDLLAETPGLGQESATLLKLTADIIRLYMDDYTKINNSILTPEAAKEYMKHKFLCISVEQTIVACLGANGKVVFSDIVTEGAPERVSISPVKIARLALRANAEKIVLAHNHPYGIATPSQTDRWVTEQLFRELQRVDLELFDHIIVAPDGEFSMREKGMLPKRENSY